MRVNSLLSTGGYVLKSSLKKSNTSLRSRGALLVAALATLAVGTSARVSFAQSQDISWDPAFSVAGGGTNVDGADGGGNNNYGGTWSSTNQNWVYQNGPLAGQPLGWNNARNDYALFPLFAGRPAGAFYTAVEPLTMSNVRFVGNNITVGATGSGMLTVTTTGSATANSTYNNGYVLAGSIRTDVGATALITAPIYAPGGLQKVDAGTLVLGGTNQITGVRSIDGTYNGSPLSYQAVNFMIGQGLNGLEYSGYVRLESSSALQTGINLGIGNAILDIGSNNVSVNNIRFTGVTGGSFVPTIAFYDGTLGANAGIAGSGTLTVTGEISGNDVGSFNGSGISMISSNIDMNGGTMFVRNVGSGIIMTGSLTNGSLTTTFAQTAIPGSVPSNAGGSGLLLYGNNTYTGPTIFNTGTVGTQFSAGNNNVIAGTNQSSEVTVINTAVSLRGALGSYGAATSITAIAGGAIFLDNNSAAVLTGSGSGVSFYTNAPTIDSAQNNDRLSDTVIVNLRDSQLSLIGRSTFAATETIGTLNALNGRNVINLTPNGTGGAATLTVAGNLDVSPLATLTITPGTVNTLGGASKMFVGGTISPAAGVGGLIPRVVTGTNFVRYDPTLGFVALTALQPTLVANDNVNLAANTTVAATTSVNALRLGISTGITTTITANQTLTVSSGMLLSGGGTQTILGPGTLAFGGTPGVMFGNFTISSAMTGSAGFITDNGTVTIAGDASGLTGTVTMNGGTVQLNNSTAANAFAVRGGTLRYSGNGAWTGTEPIVLGATDNPGDFATSGVGITFDVSRIAITNVAQGAGNATVVQGGSIIARNIIVDNGGATAGGSAVVSNPVQFSVMSNGRTYSNAGVNTRAADTQTFSGNLTLNTAIRIQGGLAFPLNANTPGNPGVTEFAGSVTGTGSIVFVNGQERFMPGSYLNLAGGLQIATQNPTKVIFDGVAANFPITFGSQATSSTVTWSSNIALPSGLITVPFGSPSFIPSVTGLNFTNQIRADGASITLAPPAGIDLFFNGTVLGTGTVVTAGLGNVIFPTGFNVPVNIASGTLSPNALDSTLPDRITVSGTGTLNLQGLTVARNGTQNINAVGGFVTNGTLIGDGTLLSAWSTSGEGTTTTLFNPVISAKISGGLSLTINNSVSLGSVGQGGWLHRNVVATLTGTNDYSGPSTFTNMTVRADVGTNLPLTNHIKLTNSVLEGAAAYNVTLGLGNGQVELVGVSGFSGWNANTNTVTPTVVTLNGGSQIRMGYDGTLAATPGLNPLALTFQSPTSNQPVVLTNDIDLNDPNSDGRNFYVLVGSNAATAADTARAVATVSGVVSGDNAQLIKNSYGILALTGTNTYSGPTKVFGGTLRFTDGVGVPLSSGLRVSGSGIIQPDVNTPFSRQLGTGAGQIVLVYETNPFIQRITDQSATAGFDAYNPAATNGATPLTVAIYSGGFGTNAMGPGDHGTATYAVGDFDVRTLTFNTGPTANAPITFHSNFDVNGGTLAMLVGTGSATGSAGTTTFTGSIISAANPASTSLTKTGPGRLVLTTANNGWVGGTFAVTGGVLALAPGASLTSNILVVSGGTNSVPAFGVPANSGTFDFTGAYSPNFPTVAGQTVTFQGVTPRIIGGYEGAGTIQFFNSNAATSSSATVNAQIINAASNVVTGSVALSKIGVGVTELQGTNSYTGPTYIADGPLRARIGGGIPVNSPIIIRNGGELQTGGSITKALGTGPGQISFPSSTGAGFANFTNFQAGALTVNIGGAAGTLTLGTPDFSPAQLTFNRSITSTGLITFANSIDMAGQNFSVLIGSGAAIGSAGTTTFSGKVNSSSGSPVLTKVGPGNLVLTNTAADAYSWSGGTINIGNPGVVNTVAGSIFMGAGTTTTNSVNVTAATSGAASVFNITAAGPLTTVSGQTFNLVGVNSNLSGTFTGSGQINISGTDSVGSSRTLGATVTGSVGLAVLSRPYASTTLTATTVSLTGALTTNGPLSVSGGGTVFPLFVAGNALIFNGPVVATTGAASLTMSGRSSSAVFQAAPGGTNSYTTLGVLSSITFVNDTNYQTFPIGRVTMTQTDRSVNRANVLVTSSIDALPTNGSYAGFIDIGNNDLIVKGGAASGFDLTNLRAMVAAWYNGGSVASVGIGSTAPGAGISFQTLAVFPNDSGVVDPNNITQNLPFYSSYDGVALTAADAIVKYTHFGDTNIDGVVNGVDLANAIEGYSTGATGWQNGDFDYNGVVNAADISRLLTALNTTLPNLGNGQGGVIPTGGQVPEPSGLLVAALAAPLMTRRRRK